MKVTYRTSCGEMLLRVLRMRYVMSWGTRHRTGRNSRLDLLFVLSNYPTGEARRNS
jgi:hypothetical protein